MELVSGLGVRVGLVSATKSHELSLLPPLRKGDRRCRENKRRKPVQKKHLETCIPLLRPEIADMMRLLEMHAMRPSEVCNIKPCMIDFDYDGENWFYAPEEHKTAGSGQDRYFVFCKSSQEILKKYMRDDQPDMPIFRNRRGNPFNTDIFGKALRKSIDKHKLPKFTLYQVRHTKATEIANNYGLDYAQSYLGHASPEMTKRYIHDGENKIKKIAEDRNRNLAKAVPDSDPSPSRPKLRIFRGE